MSADLIRALCKAIATERATRVAFDSINEQWRSGLGDGVCEPANVTQARNARDNAVKATDAAVVILDGALDSATEVERTRCVAVIREYGQHSDINAEDARIDGDKAARRAWKNASETCGILIGQIEAAPVDGSKSKGNGR